MNDLMKHLLVGAAISTVLVVIGIALFGKYLPDWYVAICFLTPLVVGILKEAHDYTTGSGTAEVADITLTWSGAVVVLVWKLIENFI